MMKKLFSMLAFAAMLSACSSGDSVVDIDDKPVTPPAPNTTEVFLGTTRSNQFIPMTTMVEESDYIAQDANVSVYKATKTFTGADVNFFTKYFPYKQANIDKYYDIKTGQYKQIPEGLRNFSVNCVFVSDGTPLNFYPVHSSVAYDDVIGLFYYDENMELHTLDFWDMEQVKWKGDPYPRPGTYVEITKSKDAEGYTLCIPEGYVFGFYVRAENDARYIHQNRAYSGQFYTWKELNLKDGADCDKFDDGGIHGSTFSDGEKTFIGFEDQEHGDRDINDIICFITPEVSIINEPTIEDIEDVVDTKTLDGEVEVDIHHQDHDDWNEIKTTIHIRDTVNVRVTIPIEQAYIMDQDDFAIRTYEAYYYRNEGNDKYPVLVTIEHKADCITIDVAGVTAEMLKALRAEGDDGITIEVHNYYKNLTDEDLWEKIKLSTVETYKNKTTIYGQIHQMDEPRDQWVPIGEGPKATE
jgi:hypothetical protein